MARARYRSNLLWCERAFLEKRIRAEGPAQQVARRARNVVLANDAGWSNRAIGDALNIHNAEVSTWTKRWIQRAMEPLAERLCELPRSGRPDTIRAVQGCGIFALACEPPHALGRPISHRTRRELADEAIRQGIVDRLSEGHRRKMLKKRPYSPTAAAIG